MQLHLYLCFLVDFGDIEEVITSDTYLYTAYPRCPHGLDILFFCSSVLQLDKQVVFQYGWSQGDYEKYSYTRR